MKTNKILITGMTVLLLASCGTHKTVVKQKDVKVEQGNATLPSTKSSTNQKLIFVQRVADQALYQKNLVSNLTFTLNDDIKTSQFQAFFTCVRMR